MTNGTEKAKSLIIESLTSGTSADCGVWDLECFEYLDGICDSSEYNEDGYHEFSGQDPWPWSVHLIRS